MVDSLFQTALFGGTKALSNLGATLTSRTAKPPVDGNETSPSTSSDPARLQAQATADSIGRVVDLAAQSKLRQRDPASFQSSVQQMAAANGVDTLHISSTDFMDALKAQGPQAETAALQRMPSVLAQLRQLPATGGDLAIPTGEMITGITGSGAEAQILPHLRLTPDKLSLAQLQQEATASEAASHKAPETNQDSPSFYFRGTTRGYTGSEATRQSGSTPTSWHPGVATLFARQAEQHGSGVLHIATPEDLSGISTGGKNWRSGLEKEIGVDLPPEEFALRSSIVITAAQARDILCKMGISAPTRIPLGNKHMDESLVDMPAMTPEQIRQFADEAAKLGE